jgi:hypothetical protein
VTFFEFQHTHEQLEAAVADALRYGPTWGLQEEYRRHRTSLQSNYPRFRSAIQEHFEAPRATGFHRPADPVEWLLSHPTLDRLLLRDSSEVAARLEQIRQAVGHCGASVGVH